MKQEITAYTVLGVCRTATQAEITAAYRAKARECHPDHGGDTAKMAKVNLAWQKLGTPEDRDAYDLRLAGLERAEAESVSAVPPNTDAAGDLGTLLSRIRNANGKGSGLGGMIADLGLASGALASGALASGALDTAGYQRVQAAATKGGKIAEDIAELIGLVRGQPRENT